MNPIDESKYAVIEKSAIEKFMLLFIAAKEMHQALRDYYIPMDRAYIMGCEEYASHYQFFRRFEDAILGIGALAPYTKGKLEDGYPEDGRLESYEQRKRRYADEHK